MQLNQVKNIAASQPLDALNVFVHPKGYMAEIIVAQQAHILQYNDHQEPAIFGSIHELRLCLGGIKACKVNLIPDH